MKAKKNSIFAIIISVLYAASIIAYITVLSIEYADGHKNAERTYGTVVTAVSSILHKAEPDTYAFVDEVKNSQELNNLLKKNTNLAGMQMTTGNQLIFSSPAEVSNFPSTRSSLVTSKQTTLYSENGAEVTLTLAIYLLRPASIYNYGKLTFFVILVLTLLCAFILFITSIRENKENSEPEFKFSNDESDKYNEINEADILNNEKTLITDSNNKSSQNLLNDEDITDSKVISSTSEENDQIIYNEKESFTDNDKNAEESTYEENDINKSYLNQNEKEQNSFEDIPVDINDFTSSAEKKDEKKSEPAGNENDSSELIVEYKDSRPSRDELFSDADILDVTSEFFDTDDSEKEDVSPKLTFVDETPSSNSENHLNDSAIETPAQARTEDEEDKIQTEEQDKENKGLFSPITGFGWESYMIPRLDSELVRAASTEQDLSLFVIRIPDINRECESAIKIWKLILDTVKFQDYVFEKGEDGCTAIFAGIDIDKSLEIAEDLHTSMISILAGNGLPVNASIGISSKSSRLISGERLFTEAEQALQHAMADKESPIVAFRVNPEKYRNYLSSEAGKLTELKNQE